MDIPEIDQQLITQLTSQPEAFDKFIEPVIKTLVKGNRVEQFVESVKKRQSQLSSQIPHLAKGSYHDCVDMINDYEEVKHSLAMLHEQVKNTHAQLSTDGKQFTASLSEEISSLKLQINVSRAKKLTEDALKVCLVAQEASMAVLDRRYEEALGKLDQVQASLYTIESLPEVVSKLGAWIDEQVCLIREQAVSGLKDWLAQLRQQSDSIGKILMGQTRTKLDELSKLPPNTPLLNNPELCISLMHVQLGEIPEIQIRDLLRIAHLFELMGKSADFAKMYTDNRRLQANVIIETPLHAHKDLSGVGFNKLLEQICGFCYSELRIRNLGVPAIPLFDNFIETTWNSFLGRIQTLELDFVRVASSGVMEQSALMNIKWSHVFFAYSVRTFAHNEHFSTLTLNDSLISLFYRYVEILKADHSERIVAILEKLNFHSCFASDVLGVLSNFLGNFSAFLQGIPQVNSELTDLAGKSVDSLLTDTLKVYITEQLPHVELSQLISCTRSLFNLIGKIPQKFQNELINSPSQLQTFTQTVLQTQIIAQVQLKVDFVIRNSTIDFSPKEPQPSPIPLFAELSKHVQTFFTVLENIPSEMIYFELCQHLSNRLMVPTQLMHYRACCFRSDIKSQTYTSWLPSKMI